MDPKIELFFISAAPMLGIVIFLLLVVLALRIKARRKSERMNRAEMMQTGMGTTTWDAYQGSPTQGPPTAESSDPPRQP